jgi:hypothetical protein
MHAKHVCDGMLVDLPPPTTYCFEHLGWLETGQDVCYSRAEETPDTVMFLWFCVP